jgi:nucleotide-binding universal stress UspA family protein
MNRIVVGVDGSEEARVALRWALHEARLRGAELMVAHVWQPLDLVVPAGTLSDPALNFQSDLDTGASRVLDAAMVELGDDIEGIDVRTQLLDDGSVAGRLVDLATGAELLVVGSRGWGSVRGRLLGSVSQQCAHHTRCPLVVVRHGTGASGHAANTIVVGVDGSPNSEAALHWALAEAERRGADVLALHAWSFPPTASIGYVPPTPLGAIRQAATACLEEVVRRASGRYPSVRCEQVVAEGAAGHVLVEAAQGASLLVVGTRGRGGFAGLLLGSVSQQCAHHAPCPIVIVPSGR